MGVFIYATSLAQYTAQKPIENCPDSAPISLIRYVKIKMWGPAVMYLYRALALQDSFSSATSKMIFAR